MRTSPLQLKKYFTTELSFSAQPDFEGTTLDANTILHSDLKVHVQWRDEEHDRQRTCFLSVALDDVTGTKFPCTFSISLVGLFEILPEWPSNMVDTLFEANAPALLYSAARESIAMVTGRSPYSQVVLPSVTFVEPPVQKAATINDKPDTHSLDLDAPSALKQIE